MTETQNERILALLRLRSQDGITPLDALREVGTMRLAARISDLRRQGHLITTETYVTPNGARVARYVLKDEPRYAPYLETEAEMQARRTAENRAADEWNANVAAAQSNYERQNEAEDE